MEKFEAGETCAKRPSAVASLDLPLQDDTGSPPVRGVDQGDSAPTIKTHFAQTLGRPEMTIPSMVVSDNAQAIRIAREELMGVVAPRAELPGANEIKGIDRLTDLFARIDRKSISRALANQDQRYSAARSKRHKPPHRTGLSSPNRIFGRLDLEWRSKGDGLELCCRNRVLTRIRPHSNWPGQWMIEGRQGFWNFTWAKSNAVALTLAGLNGQGSTENGPPKRLSRPGLSSRSHPEERTSAPGRGILGFPEV